MSDFSPSRDPNRRYIARFIVRMFVFAGLIGTLLTVFARPLPLLVLGSGTGEFIGAIVIFLLIPLLIVSTLRSSNRFQSRRYENRMAREEARQQVRETLREFRDDFRAVRAARHARELPEKQKNAAADMDMYSLIDRMITELDDDEIAYLQQKLETRTDPPNPDLPQSIGDLLNKRAEHRLGE